MNFKREVAMVLNEEMVPLTVVLGGPGSVIFPDRFIWKFHYARPGYIKYFVHTHPSGITGISEEDRTTLKAWSYAFYPFILQFLVVTLVGQALSIKNHWYEIESLEEWKAKGKKGERKVKLMESYLIKPEASFTPEFVKLAKLDWIKTILELSYAKD